MKMKTKSKKKSKGKRHPTSAASFLRIAKDYRRRAEFWRTTDSDPHGISTGLYVAHAESADILEKEAKYLRTILR